MLPLLPAFLARYPRIKPDWRFENHQIDLIAEGYDVAIGGGFELAPGIVSRVLAPLHVVAVASPVYMKDRGLPADPSDLLAFRGIVLRSSRTGRLRQRIMREVDGTELAATLAEDLVVNDSAAMLRAATLGLGVALVAVPDALPHLESGSLVRLLPRWCADLGPISLYYASRTLLPAKTRVFVDFVTEEFKRQKLAERFAGQPGSPLVDKETVRR
jgi:DNA-binding transcriptional LysR family regulator